MKKRYVEKLWNLSVLRKRETNMNLLICILVLFVVLFLFLFLREMDKRKQEMQKQKDIDKMLTKYIADNIDMEKKLADMQYDYEKQQDMAEEVRKIQEQIRALKHDMKNHTLVILSYLEENRVKEAKDYAGEILDKLNKMYTYVNVGNSLLNYIMNNKLSMAKSHGVEIKAEIENLAFDYMDSVDFSALLNNMLDNAILGALESGEKKLEVQIMEKKGFDIITVKNSIDESVLEKNPEFVSTKEEPGHGYGMKQIRSIVDKYQGAIDIYEKGNMFIVSIMLG